MKKQSVKMKVNEMLNAHAGIVAVTEEKKLFAGEVNLAIARNYKILQTEVKTYNESIKKLVEKYVHKDSKGNPETKEVKKGTFEYVFETDEQKEAYKRATDSLGNTELEVEINMISESTFGTEYEHPTAFDLISLDFMIMN